MDKLISGRIAFSLFGTEIYWYGIIMAFSILVAFILVLFYCSKKKLGTDFAFGMLLATVLPGILSARLFSVLFEDDSSILDFFKFRDGGMSIIGAIMGGVIGITIYALIKKKNFFEISDIVAPVLILGQAIGRWGNFANQEVYGMMVTDPSLQWFPYAVFIDSEHAWFQALFFYESMLSLIGFALLTTLLFKSKKKGIVTGTYLLFYGIVRSIMEGMRSDEFVLKLAGFPVSRILSYGMIIAGFAILVFVLFFQKNKNQKNKTSTQTTKKQKNVQIKKGA